VSDARSLSRREVLAKAAGVASVLALPQLWIPKAWGATATTFDYYISTSGNDSNPGTLAAPWALTSFTAGSANNNLMAGKKIGIIAGNYTFAGLPEHAGDYNYAKINLPGGTATNQTVVASCDTNGNYSARAATLTWSGANTDNALIGNGDASGGYITIDGLRINGGGFQITSTGAGISNGAGEIVRFFGNSTSGCNYRLSALCALTPGIIVQNCELYNINPQGSLPYSSTGGNYAALAFISCVAPICRNNLIHDVLYSGTDTQAVSHQAAILDLGCPNSQYLNNTIYNSTGGIWVKEGSTGTLAAYNYIYACATTALEQSNYNAVFTGWDGGGGNPNPGPAPTRQSIHHNVIEGCGPVRNPGANWPSAATIAVNAYNNTVYETTSNGVRGWDQAVTGDTAEYYNNIYMNTAGGSGSPGSVWQGKLSLWSGNYSTVDYNCYFATTGSYATWWQFVPSSGVNNTYSALSAWKTATGAEAHSITGNPSFTLPGGYVAGGGANQFTLASGSPCLGTGKGGVNIGAWDGTTTQIGCSFGPGSSGSTAPAVPVAPSLTVS
jgi:hypothetical protein